MISEIIAAIVGGLLTYGGSRFTNRLQKMKCHLILDDIQSKISIPIDGIVYNNVYSKEFLLVNTTSKDIDAFDVIFTFDPASSIIECHSKSKEGIDWHTISQDKRNPNIAIAKVKDFNRKDEISFFFRVGNVTDNQCVCTESGCTGFKIKLLKST